MIRVVNVPKPNQHQTQGCHLADNFIDFRDGKIGDNVFEHKIIFPFRINIKQCIGTFYVLYYILRVYSIIYLDTFLYVKTHTICNRRLNE